MVEFFVDSRNTSWVGAFSSSKCTVKARNGSVSRSQNSCAIESIVNLSQIFPSTTSLSISRKVKKGVHGSKCRNTGTQRPPCRSVCRRAASLRTRAPSTSLRKRHPPSREANPSCRDAAVSVPHSPAKVVARAHPHRRSRHPRRRKRHHFRPRVPPWKISCWSKSKSEFRQELLCPPPPEPVRPRNWWRCRSRFQTTARTRGSEATRFATVA